MQAAGNSSAKANIQLPPVQTLLGFQASTLGQSCHDLDDEALLCHLAQHIEHFVRSHLNLAGSHNSTPDTLTPASYLGTDEVCNCLVRDVDNLCQVVSLSVRNKHPWTPSIVGSQCPPPKKPRLQSIPVPSAHQQLCCTLNYLLPQFTYPPPPPPPHQQCHACQLPSQFPLSSLQLSMKYPSSVCSNHQAAAPQLTNSHYSTFDMFIPKATFHVVAHNNECSNICLLRFHLHTHD